MKVLITGSTGFVGSCIFKHLSQLSSLHIETISIQKDIKKIALDGVKHFVVDLADEKSLSDFLRKNKYDLLIHAAWEGLPLKDSDRNEKNIKMSVNLFENFIEFGGKNIIGLGSCLEYGDVRGQVCESSRGSNLTGFGKSKRLLGAKLSRLGIPYIWLRPFYLYGSSQHSNSLFNMAINQRESDSYSWMKDPFVSHDFVYIEDLGRLVVRLVSEELWIGELNVGTSIATKNISIVNSIRLYLGESGYEFQDVGNDGLAADLTKFETLLPNFDFISLEKGLSVVMRQLIATK